MQKKFSKVMSPKTGEEGITLIALIITIIVMLILVGVTVKTVVDSGLFTHSRNATTGYSMQQTREQLSATLASAQIEKYSKTEYNQNDYLDKYITNFHPKAKIIEDIVILDNWAFELDRNVPKIIQCLGEEGSFSYPDLKIEKELLSDDKLSIPIKITTKEIENGISKIEIYLDGKIIKSFDDCNNSKLEIVRTFIATENGNYSIKVYSKINRSAYISIMDIVPLEPQIGDYVSYIPDISSNYTLLGTASNESQNPSGSSSNSSSGIPQDNTLKWRILNINEDGSFELISDKPISTNIYFKGALGFNNGVLLLNDLCRTQYSNTELNAIGRSINLLDIENHLTNEGISARNNSDNGHGIKYGTTGTFANEGRFLPDIYLKVNKDSQGESTPYYETPTSKTYEETSGITGKQTYYTLTMKKNFYDNELFYDLIFNTNVKYWIASRCMSWYYSGTFRRNDGITYHK